MFRVVRAGRHIIIEPEAAHSATMVWLHGVGESAESGLRQFTDPQFALPGLKTVLLTSRTRPFSLHGNNLLNIWYNVRLRRNKARMSLDVVESAREVSRVLETEAKSTTRMFLGGFSQGGSLALFLTYSYLPAPVQGVVALSSYTFPLRIPEECRRIPALCCHGDADAIVPLRLAQASYQSNLLRVDYSLKVFPGLRHQVSDEVRLEVKTWLQKQMAEK